MHDNDPWKFAVMRRFDKIDDFINHLNQKENKIMATLKDVQDGLAKLQADDAALTQFLNAVVTQNTADKQTIADLQAQLAAGNAISAADLNGIASGIAAIDAAVTAALPVAP